MRRWKCKVCGYIHEGDQSPDRCPVCNADGIHIVEVDDKGGESAVAGAKAVEPPPAEAAKKATFRDKLAALVLRQHLHPIIVNIPNGVLPAAVVFIFLASILGLAMFKDAAFYNLVFVLLAMPLVMATGYLEWRNRYKKARTVLFLTKIVCSLVVLVSLLVLVAWRLIDPTVTDAGSANRLVYLGLSLVMLGATGLAGHLGGKLVFAARDRKEATRAV